MRLVRSIIRNEPYNEHVFAPRLLDAVRTGIIGRNAIGVVDRRVSRYRRVQMERAYIAQVVRLQNPDLVIFHTPTLDEEMARIAVGALHGTRQRMMTYRYDARPVQRGTLRRIVLSRISLWVVPTLPAARVLEAAGIDRERIRVLRPPVRRPQAIPQDDAREALSIPTGKPVVSIVDPSPSEVALLAPTLQLMQDYEQPYSLVIADPSEAVTPLVTPLVQGSGGQAVVVLTEAPETVQPGTPALVGSQPLREAQLVAAADATLVLDWDQSVRRPAIQAMMGAREVLTVSTEESLEATGDKGTYIQAGTPAQVTSSLAAYTPDSAKATEAATFARQEYDEAEKTKDHRQAHLDTLPVRARTRGSAVPAA